MAIFYMAVQTIRRAGGRSAAAAAAYRAGVRIEDARTGERHDYSRRGGVVACGLIGWDGTREDLWNAAEAAEKRRDAVVAREIVVALPHELSYGSHRAAVDSFARFLAERHGVAIDWAIHAPDRRGSGLNHHAPLMLTTRRVERGRLALKTRELDTRPASRAHVEAWRSEWARLCNEALRTAGHRARIDHRSYRRQAQETQTPPLRPQIKLGPAPTRLLRRGLMLPAARTNVLRAAINADIRSLQRETEQLFALVLNPLLEDEPEQDRRARVRDWPR